MDRHSYTIADLVKLTGAKKRAVQMWAETGVVKAAPESERAGTGVHRRFSRDEVIIASIINVLSRMRVSVGTLLSLSKDLRDGLERGVSDEGVPVRDIMDKAIANSEEVYLFLNSWGGDGSPVGWEMRIEQEDLGTSTFKGDAGHLRQPLSSSVVVLLNTLLFRLRH